MRGSYRAALSEAGNHWADLKGESGQLCHRQGLCVLAGKAVAQKWPGVSPPEAARIFRSSWPSQREEVPPEQDSQASGVEDTSASLHGCRPHYVLLVSWSLALDGSSKCQDVLLQTQSGLVWQLQLGAGQVQSSAEAALHGEGGVQRQFGFTESDPASSPAHGSLQGSNDKRITLWDVFQTIPRGR